MAAWLANKAKALTALIGGGATVLLAEGNLGVHELNEVWPLVAAIVTAFATYTVPNARK